MPQSGFTPIITYNTATASAAPSAGNLTQGELAVNVTDKKIYTKNSGGSVVQVGSGPDATETLTNKTLTSPDINGGTIDGAAIGSTTPAAVSATTLSASGDVTLGNAGTDLLNIGAGSVIKDASGFVGIGVDPSANGAALQILKTTNGWSSSNFGKTLLVRTNGNHPTIALPDVNDANNFAITNQTGVLNISAMPALSNNSTAPVNILSATYAGAVTIPGTLSVNTTSTSAKAVVGTGVPKATTASTDAIWAASGDASNAITLAIGINSNATASSRGAYLQAAEQGVAYRNLLIQPDGGNVQIGSPSGSGAVTIPGTLSLTGGTFGYGTGAGGTVTQATSKSTAVTLNKPCGQITMNNAALGAGAVVAFVVNNSYFGPNDSVEVNVAGGVALSEPYLVQASSNGSTGAFAISLRNLSAGSLSEAVVVKFQVHSGATS